MLCTPRERRLAVSLALPCAAPLPTLLGTPPPPPGQRKLRVHTAELDPGSPPCWLECSPVSGCPPLAHPRASCPGGSRQPALPGPAPPHALWLATRTTAGAPSVCPLGRVGTSALRKLGVWEGRAGPSLPRSEGFRRFMKTAPPRTVRALSPKGPHARLWDHIAPQCHQPGGPSPLSGHRPRQSCPFCVQLWVSSGQGLS